MRILHLIWKPSIGGAELFAKDLARRQSNEHDVCLYYLGANDADVVDDGITKIYAGGMKSGFDIVGLLRFAKFIRMNKFNVIHNHQNLPSAAVAMVAAPGVLLVRHEHGTREDGWKSGRERFLSRLINRFVPVYIANSKSTREKLVKHEGISPGRIVVIPCGIDLSRFSGARTAKNLRGELGISNETPVVGFLGRLHRQKGVDDFVKIATLIHKERPEARFIITGGGDSGDDLIEKIHEAGLNEVVQLLGFRKDVERVLASYDILAITSRREAQGLVAAEAMASGTCVVAFSVDGLPEVIGDAGVLVGNRDKDAMARRIVGLIGDKVQRNKYIEIGYGQAMLFDMDCITARMIELYEEYGNKTD